MKKYRLGEVCEINPKKIVPESVQGSISFIPMNAVSVDGKIDSTQSVEVEKIKNYSFFKDEDVLFAKITPCMENGKGAIAKNLKQGYGAGSTEFIVVRPKQMYVLPRWIYLFLSQKPFRLFCQQHMTGSAGQKRVPPKFLSECEIPVPEVSEQKRIIEKIEEMFSNLDASISELRAAKEKLKVYRQAVLKEAFPQEGREYCIKEICRSIKVGIVIKPTQYYVSENGVYAFRNGNVRPGYIEDNDWVMISKSGHQKNLKSEVHTGDVLISRSGANLGMASAVPEKYNGYNAIDVVIAVPDLSMVLPEFLAHYTNSPKGQAIVKEKERGAAQGHLNVTAYGQLQIWIPSLDKQREIVKEIEDRLSVCDSIESTIDSALQQADALRQSILKEAFEGRI